jgi:AmpE protein
MKFVALFVAVVLERLATQLFHWRDLRWLDPLFDRGIALALRAPSVPPLFWMALTLGVAILPVLLVRLAIGDVLLHLPYVALSVVVLFLCLGPQDIGEQVNDWCDAVEGGDEEQIRQRARALLEREPGAAGVSSTEIEEAVFIQANNRMFAVIFWFIVLGPVGAWLFRVADLLRRRALFKQERSMADRTEPSSADEIADAYRAQAVRDAALLHAVLAWAPARVSVLGYALAGNFDGARLAWQGFTGGGRDLGTRNERLLARVGLGALQADAVAGESEAECRTRCARAAKNLALRTLMVWLVGFAALTLAGLAI